MAGYSHDMRRPLTKQELLAELENLTDDEEVDAVYIPPEVDELTDEENLDDNIMQDEGNTPRYSGFFRNTFKHRKAFHR